MEYGPWVFLDWGAGKDFEASASNAQDREGHILSTLDMIPQPPTACKRSTATITTGRACPVAGKLQTGTTVILGRIARSDALAARKCPDYVTWNANRRRDFSASGGCEPPGKLH